MVQREEVLQSFLNTAAVVDDDVGTAQRVCAGVHEHCGNIAASQIRKQCRVSFGSHDGHAVNLSFDHTADTFGHTFGLVIGVGDDDFQAFLNGLVFEMFYQFRKKRISDVGNDQAKHSAAAGD